jgi:hypothetical protein
MSDVGRLQRWFAEGVLVPPSADEPGTVHLGRALASLARAPSIPLDAPSSRVAGAIGRADHYVFVLVDGLGMNLVETLPGDSFLRAHVAMELRSVHPSGTPAGLTSIATGLWPSEHGVIGWFEYLEQPDLLVTTLPFVERFSRRPLGEFGVTPQTLYPQPTLMPRFACDAAAFMPAFISDSAYSRYFTGGCTTYGYDTLPNAMRDVRRRIQSTPGPTYTYVYIPFVDQAEHVHGVYADPVRAALRDVDKSLARLAEGVTDGVRIVVSADHGQIDVHDEDTHLIDDGDHLLELLAAPPTGDPRVALFHVRARKHDTFEDAFRQRFLEQFALLTTAEAEALHMLGPGVLSALARKLSGDYVAIPRGPSALMYKPESPMRGYHGGMARDEVRIPLVVA